MFQAKWNKSSITFVATDLLRLKYDNAIADAIAELGYSRP